jgi:hypothetical protein
VKACRWNLVSLRQTKLLRIQSRLVNRAKSKVRRLMGVALGFEYL